MENMLCIFIESSKTQKRRKTSLLCIAGVASPGNMLYALERYMDASIALFQNGWYIFNICFLHCVWKQNSFLLYGAIRQFMQPAWMLRIRFGRNVPAKICNVWNFESRSCVESRLINLAKKFGSTFKIPLVKHDPKFCRISCRCLEVKNWET
jgi:hypothetical protein